MSDMDALYRERFHALVRAYENAGCAIALLARNYHNILPPDLRERLTRIRSQLSVLQSELVDLIREGRSA